MKIARLDLIAYGPFSECTLDLSAGRHGLHLIHGPNEAGKSSCLRAITAFLFGIDQRTPDAFLHPYQKLRLGAELVDAAGTRHRMLRVKKRQSLLDADDETAIDEARLLKLLGGVDREAFQSRFGIDHEQLVAGGEAIVEGKGDIGEILFAAGAGLGNLKAIREQLESEADALFTERSHAREIDAALREWRDARERVEAAKLRPAEWQRHRQELDEAIGERDAIEQTLADARRRAAKLDCIAKALRLLPDYRSLRDKLAELQSVPQLDEQFSERRRDAQNRRQLADDQRGDFAGKLVQVEEELARIEPRPEFLEKAEEIERLLGRYASYQDWTRDLPLRHNEAKKIDQQIEHMMIKAGQSSEAEQILCRSSDEVRVRNLAQQYQSLVDARSAAEIALAGRSKEKQAAEQALAKLPSPVDVGPLEQTYRKVNRAGDLEAEWADAARILDERRDRWTIGCKRLPGYRGERNELIALPVPTKETIEQFAGDAADDAAARRGQVDQLEAQQRQLAQLRDKIQETAGDDDLPTEEDLRLTVQQRDVTWQGLKDDWPSRPRKRPTTTGDAQHPQFDRAAQQRIAEYERLVAEVDQLAERLRTHANQIAHRAALAGQLSAAEDKHSQLQEALRQLDERIAAREQQWRQLWAELGVDARTPAEMRSWREQFDALCRDAIEIRSGERELAALGERIEGAKSEMVAVLTACEARIGPGDALVDLLDIAQELLEDQHELREKRARLEENHNRLETEIASETERLATAEARLDDWRQQWSEAVRPLGLRDQVSADEASEVLRNLRDAEALLGRKTDLEERIHGIESEIHNYASWAATLVAQLAPQLGDRSLAEVVDELARCLHVARDAAAQQESRRQQQHELQHKLAEAQSAGEQATAELRTLCQEAGADEPEELPEVERRSSQKRQWQLSFDGLESQLLQLAGSDSLTEFLAEADRHEASEIEPQRQKLLDETAEAEQRHRDVSEIIGREKEWIARHDGSSAAAAAAIDVEHQVAVVGSLAGRYARLRLASVVLRKAIERYRAKNESGVLHRAGELFSRLTLGSFDGLRGEQDAAGNNVLTAIRAGGDTIGVEAMSDGTSDQLYLALRLASLERHYAERGPMPFIVDDILNRYDDARAVAALQALAELSRVSQVIFFTHHAHLVDLAREHLNDEVLFVHELAGLREVAL
ncbi:MAG: AAA family ATPase [Pirellulales bacterium]